MFIFILVLFVSLSLSLSLSFFLSLCLSRASPSNDPEHFQPPPLLSQPSPHVPLG